LLCFPHGGGSPSTFNAWPETLPEDIEVCAVQLPGRGRRLFEAPPTSICQIIEALLKALQPFGEAPIALFGHSLGAWIAFEFARQLQSKSIPILHLFISGQPAPQLPDPEAPIRNFPDQEFISEVRRRYDGLPEEVLSDNEMMKLSLPALRADFTIKETYQYTDGPTLDCPVSCFGGYNDGSVSADDLAAWRDRACSTFNLRMFPGGHFFIDNARESVLKCIAAELESSLRN
jgi:medium-chain acyl-[acyl-carrier-protein] hydrolase